MGRGRPGIRAGAARARDPAVERHYRFLPRTPGTVQGPERVRERARLSADRGWQDTETPVDCGGRAMTGRSDTVVLDKVLTQADFDAFAELSGDDNPIHVDPAFCAKTRFGRTVSHGMLLSTVLRGLIDQLVPG